MAARRLRVDWPACKAHGICAELLPELIQQDPWGYPLVSVEQVPAALLSLSERAVSSCPTLALRLVEVPDPSRGKRDRRRSRA